MSNYRDNHYVPQWYQHGFVTSPKGTLNYLDLSPARRILTNGREVTEKSRFKSYPAQCFMQRDLYSTFFGANVNDEIERRLFGRIDVKGAAAVRAFIGKDTNEWHRHFSALFEFMDSQKLRTPKGLAWIKSQYLSLGQNGLMQEMQGLRTMHCTVWTECVREIVSANNSETKFIVTDHPVTIYNHALPPSSLHSEPSILLTASQTIFPLDKNECLILTNLEYCNDPHIDPIRKRTFARQYRTSFTRTDAFIRTRQFSDSDVAAINLIMKRSAKRYVAAGQENWLYPEEITPRPWAELREVLLPKDELWRFGGEMYARFDDGRVHYQDAYGRTEKPRKFLHKAIRDRQPSEECGCGSGRKFKQCCQIIAPAMRPSWSELSIRERNLAFLRGISNVLGIDGSQDWDHVRKNLTDAQISEVYLIYASLWPLETDLLSLLPKPDGRCRAVYTGAIDPRLITDSAIGLSLYFDTLIVESPFVHAGILRPEYSPIENPASYRLDFLKNVLFFITIMPLVELGYVNLIPDPSIFDEHLRDEMMNMAKQRTAALKFDPKRDPRVFKLQQEDAERAILSLPKQAQIQQLKRSQPGISDAEIESMLKYLDRMRQSDPLSVYQTEDKVPQKGSGTFQITHLAPNFEMALYLSKATGSIIVTDSVFRWEELIRNIYSETLAPSYLLKNFSDEIEKSEFLLPRDVRQIIENDPKSRLLGYAASFENCLSYLKKIESSGVKPNFEKSVAANFRRIHSDAQQYLRKGQFNSTKVKMKAVIPAGGIRDNTVNRLLLMSSSEHHARQVAMALFVELDASGKQT